MVDNNQQTTSNQSSSQQRGGGADESSNGQLNDGTLGRDADFDFKQENIDIIARNAAKNVCTHYDRKCTVKCEVCNQFYPCKICHDNEQNIAATQEKD